MNILVLGSGGREHALAWQIFKSPKTAKLFVAPGNAGTAQFAENLPVAVDDFKAIRKAVMELEVDLVLVGPEVPLVLGITDFFESDPELSRVSVIGPHKAGALLEGSKEFAKEFMLRHQIPTASYRSFGADQFEEACDYLSAATPPFVLKADGLAAGKGVLILDDIDAAKSALREMLLESKFGEASSRVVIEEFLSGIEMSCFVLTDGKQYKILPTAKDYKRIGEGDTGLNTGGMGAISPVPFADEAFMNKVEDRIIKPTINGLRSEGIPYLGFIFIGLIKVNEDPYVIEYNVRMGDPETEVVIPRIASDFVELLQAAANQTLDKVDLEIQEESAATVMMVSGGYPGKYAKGLPVSGLDKVSDAVVFHAGTRLDDQGATLTNGGRVLSVTAFGIDFRSALKKSYENAARIHFDGAYYRKDIGFDL